MPELIHVMNLSNEEREDHEYWMKEAMKEALKAQEKDEVPIGAVIVYQGQIIGRGHNIRETQNLATGHAEIQAIEAANHYLGAWRLEGARLYVTLEPCPMCAGAAVLARIDTIIYACRDPKGGCTGSLMNLAQEDRFNHQTQVIEGVLDAACSQMMKDFFKKLRKRKKLEKLSTKTVDNADL